MPKAPVLATAAFSPLQAFSAGLGVAAVPRSPQLLAFAAGRRATGGFGQAVGLAGLDTHQPIQLLLQGSTRQFYGSLQLRKPPLSAVLTTHLQLQGAPPSAVLTTHLQLQGALLRAVHDH